MKPLIAVCIAASFIWAGVAAAEPADPVQAKPVLSAQASNPHALGWMQGFPPAADKTIRFTAPDYFAFPKQRWTVCNFRQLMPTVGVAQALRALCRKR